MLMMKNESHAWWRYIYIWHGKLRICDSQFISHAIFIYTYIHDPRAHTPFKAEPPQLRLERVRKNSRHPSPLEYSSLHMGGTVPDTLYRRILRLSMMPVANLSCANDRAYTRSSIRPQANCGKLQCCSVVPLCATVCVCIRHTMYVVEIHNHQVDS